MIPNGLGQPDLRLPHAFLAPLAPPVQKQDYRPQLVIVFPPIFWQIHLIPVRRRPDLDSAI